MRKKTPPSSLKAIEAAGQDPRRGALFWWLYDNHDGVRQSAGKRRINRSHFLANIPEADRLDGEGKAATDEVARKTWLRVRAFVRDERAERRAKQRPARVPTPKANTSPPRPAPPPGQPRAPVSWVVSPAPPAPSHSRPTAGEPTTAPMTEGQRLAADLLEELKRRP